MASNVSSRRQQNLYNAFDTITEPGRGSPPRFMRRTKTRRTKTAVTLAIFCTILIVWGWRGSGIDIIPRSYRYIKTHADVSLETPSNPETVSDAEAPLMAHLDEEPEHAEPGGASGAAKSGPAFHLLIPASESTSDLCKTLLSAFVLGYPAPTLINWGKSYHQSAEEWAYSHAEKIRGVYNFLSDDSRVKDDDLVLIVDGYDVWFQLPAQILIRRYHDLVESADSALKHRYGMVPGTTNSEPRTQRYHQRVIFGADKICWPNPKEDPACAAVPYSTLAKDAYGPQTDKDPEGFTNRPRFLNSGNVIGPASDVRNILKYALEKVDETHRGDLGDQLVFAEIFGEQEFQRETQRIASQTAPSRWRDFILSTLGTSESPLSANTTINNMTVVAGQRYEYSIGLDYQSRLFQTMTHSAEDVAYITYNSSAYLTTFQATHNALHSVPLNLPIDLQTAQPPCTYASPGNHSEESVEGRKTNLLPHSPKLDVLPPDPADPRQPSWRSIPLATNIYAASIPVLLHINGDKTLLETWWPKMWFHKFARALLRRFIRSTQTAHAARSAAAGGLDWWDMRGGRGGVWTDNAQWMGWSEVCKGFDDEIFQDGQGTFGKEEGDGKVVNSFGKILIGDDGE